MNYPSYTSSKLPDDSIFIKIFRTVSYVVMKKKPGTIFGNAQCSNQDFFLSLTVQIKQAFETWIKDNCKFQINHLPDSWNSLSVWQYPDVLSTSTTFDLMIKGFIPSDLTHELSKYLYKKDASDAINLLVSKAIDIFYEDIWAHRCRLFIEKELALGINQSSKTNRSTPSIRTSIPSPVHQPPTSPSRWITWISQSILQRKPWTDFRTYINS